MSVHTLALELADLDIEPLRPGDPDAITLETVHAGHGMTEVAASFGGPSCSASCCIACCCCCCD